MNANTWKIFSATIHIICGLFQFTLFDHVSVCLFVCFYVKNAVVVVVVAFVWICICMLEYMYIEICISSILIFLFGIMLWMHQYGFLSATQSIVLARICHRKVCAGWFEAAIVLICITATVTCWACANYDFEFCGSMIMRVCLFFCWLVEAALMQMRPMMESLTFAFC